MDMCSHICKDMSLNCMLSITSKKIRGPIIHQYAELEISTVIKRNIEWNYFNILEEILFTFSGPRLFCLQQYTSWY